MIDQSFGAYKIYKYMKVKMKKCIFKRAMF